MKRHYLVILILLNVAWAASPSTYKRLEAYLDYGAIVTLRFGLAALGLLLCWPLLPGRAPQGRALIRALGMGVVVFALGHRLQALGVRLGTAGNSALLTAMEPLVTAVAAAVFLRERVSARRWVGFGLGLVGVLLLNGVWRLDLNWVSLGASLLFVCSFGCEAAYSVMGKPLLAQASAVKVLALALAGGLIANLLIDGPSTLAAASSLPASGWVMVGFLAGLCTMIGYAVWYVVIRETEVNLAALTIFVQPVAGMVLAAWWVGEPLHAGQLWGSVAIVAGLGIGLQLRPAAARPEAAPASVSPGWPRTAE
jgi:drug/metabolite transporter (DMT)-like permease